MSLLLLLKGGEGEEEVTSPIVETSRATRIIRTRASLKGLVTSGGSDTKYWFEYWNEDDNICPNKDAVDGIVGYGNVSLTAFESVDLGSGGHPGEIGGVGTAFHATSNALLDRATFDFDVIEGEIYLFSFFVYVKEASTSKVALACGPIAEQFKFAKESMIENGWERINLVFTATETATYRFSVGQSQAGTSDFYFTDGVLVSPDFATPTKSSTSPGSAVNELVEEVAKSLDWESTYRFHIVGENISGIDYGEDLTFLTEEFTEPQHKISIRKLSVEWKLFLVDSETMEEIREIKHARDRNFQLAVNKAGGCDFNVPLSYDLFKEVEPIRYGIAAYRNGQPRYSGMVWGLEEATENNSLKVSSVGWFETLNHRILRLDVGYPPFGAGSMTGGEIVFANPSGTPGNVNYFPGGLLTIANEQRDTWIVEGLSTDEMKRVIAYQKGQSIGSAITQLTEVEAGFTFEIHPITRLMEITNWDEVEDKTEDVIFGFNWGPKNISRLGRQFDPSTMVNRYTALGKFGGGFAEDIPSQDKYQLFEEQTQLSEVVDPNVLLAYAGGEVLIRMTPRVVHSFQPFPYTPGGSVPAPFEDYDLGDLVSFTAVKPPRINIQGQAARVFGMNISVSNEGNEKVTGLQISPS